MINFWPLSALGQIKKECVCSQLAGQFSWWHLRIKTHFFLLTGILRNEPWKLQQLLSVLWPMYVSKISDFKNQAYDCLDFPRPNNLFEYFFTILNYPFVVYVWTELGFLYFMLQPWSSCSSVIWNNLMRYWLFAQHALKLLLQLWKTGLLRRGRKKGEFLMQTVDDFLSTWWFELDVLNQRHELFNCKWQIWAQFVYLEFRTGSKLHIFQET